MISDTILEDPSSMPVNQMDIATEPSHNSLLIIKPLVKVHLKILVGDSLSNFIIQPKLTSNSNLVPISDMVVLSSSMEITIPLKPMIYGGTVTGTTVELFMYP